MKSFNTAVIIFSLLLVSMSLFTDVSGCEIKRRGDCCYRGSQKCCMVSDSGRTACYSKSGCKYIKRILIIYMKMINS